MNLPICHFFGLVFSTIFLRTSGVLCLSSGVLFFSSGNRYYLLQTFKQLSYVVDLADKMTGISLYGIVRDISRNSESRFSLKIEDATGAIWAKLNFIRSWSLGRLGVGHTVYISGLSSWMTRRKRYVEYG
ncbi:uncharacterized protein LOC142539578 isoform X2 [Primulina tabacum]|uniref:uncharacterized protein LOC142539578 isoform X2 n=1 Tax=Primulina tabacum TaxID=48773 RepID=UPI003F5974DA